MLGFSPVSSAAISDDAGVFTSAVADASVSSTAVSFLRIVSSSVQDVAASSTLVDALLIYIVKMFAQSSTFVSARKKWELASADVENWDGQAASTATWSQQSAGGASWNNAN